MLIRLLVFIFAFSISNQIIGQDIHLSQFYASDHLLSPAKVGDFEGSYRVTGNYRNQWRQISTPISTYIISYDRAFHYYSHEIDGGILVAQDEFAGFNQTMTKVLVTGGYAYNHNGNILRLGMQGGLVFRKTDLTKQSFPSQWDYSQGTFDRSITNQENNINENTSYVDFNSGVQWSKQYAKFKAKVGFALNHINRPNDEYFSNYITTLESLNMRKVVYLEADYKINSKFSVQPRYLLMWTTKANNFVLASNIKRHIDHKVIQSVYAGGMFRHSLGSNNDAAVLVVGTEINDFNFGLSYDVNTSDLSQQVDSRRGTFEVSIIYTAPSFAAKKITIPCDRY